MGKKLDALFGRNFKTSKLRALINLAFSRLAVLKNQRQVRWSHAISDVVQLLQLGHHERALLRVEQVIKEQNMLDVYAMVESYCNLLIERLNLLEHERECPDELKEAISGLVFASSRCGDFPELTEIRSVLTSRFGKDFTARAVELRNNSGVNLMMIQKLSTRQPNLESKMKVLKEIASENSIVLQVHRGPPVSTEEKIDVLTKQNQPEQDNEVREELKNFPEEIETDGSSNSIRGRRKYRDVADAAQAAFESAAYAAAAARAAVELSRSASNDPDDQNSPHHKPRNLSKTRKLDLEYVSEKKNIHNENETAEVKPGETAAELVRSISGSSTGSAGVSSNEENRVSPFERDVASDDSDYDIGNQPSTPTLKQIPSRFQSDLKMEPGHTSGMESAQRLNIGKSPISVRTRRVRGY